MSDAIFKPRPATIPFGKDEGKTAYPAKVVESPFDKDAPEIANAYSNKNGDIIFSANFSDWYVLPKDGKEAYKIATTGTATTSIGGRIVDGEVSFSTDVKGKNESTLKIDEATKQASFDGAPVNTLSVEDKAELLKSSKKNIKFLGFPDVRTIENAFQLPDGNHLIVSANAAHSEYSYDTLRVFKGKDLKDLKEIPVTGIERYRDGGTTYYKTKEGTLFSPIGRDKNPTWMPVDSDEPITLKKLDTGAISKQIGEADTRIIGIKTWDEYLKESEKSNNLDPKMQKALDEFKKDGAAPSGSPVTLPQKQKEQSSQKQH